MLQYRTRTKTGQWSARWRPLSALTGDHSAQDVQDLLLGLGRFPMTFWKTAGTRTYEIQVRRDWYRPLE